MLPPMLGLLLLPSSSEAPSPLPPRFGTTCALAPLLLPRPLVTDATVTAMAVLTTASAAAAAAAGAAEGAAAASAVRCLVARLAVTAARRGSSAASPAAQASATTTIRGGEPPDSPGSQPTPTPTGPPLAAASVEQGDSSLRASIVGCMGRTGDVQPSHWPNDWRCRQGGFPPRGWPTGDQPLELLEGDAVVSDSWQDMLRLRCAAVLGARESGAEARCCRSMVPSSKAVSPARVLAAADKGLEAERLMRCEPPASVPACEHEQTWQACARKVSIG